MTNTNKRPMKVIRRASQGDISDTPRTTYQYGVELPKWVSGIYANALRENESYSQVTFYTSDREMKIVLLAIFDNGNTYINVSPEFSKTDERVIVENEGDTLKDFYLKVYAELA